MNYLAVNIGSQFGSPFGVTNTLGDLVSLLLKASFTIAGLLILFFIAFAGFQMIAGAGSGNPESAKKGREAATAAVLGFVIIFVAYWIVRIIEIITGLRLIS
ncbi:MAG TPA: hypothetical protein VF185_02085 [Patescibacteria group bacterium]